MIDVKANTPNLMRYCFDLLIPPTFSALLLFFKTTDFKLYVIIDNKIPNELHKLMILIIATIVTTAPDGHTNRLFNIRAFVF